MWVIFGCQHFTLFFGLIALCFLLTISCLLCSFTTFYVACVKCLPTFPVLSFYSFLSISSSSFSSLPSTFEFLFIRLSIPAFFFLQSLCSFLLSKYVVLCVLQGAFYTIELLKHDFKIKWHKEKKDWWRSRKSTQQLRVYQMVTVVTRVKGAPRDLLWEWLIIPGRGCWNSEGN